MTPRARRRLRRLRNAAIALVAWPAALALLALRLLGCGALVVAVLVAFSVVFLVAPVTGALVVSGEWLRRRGAP